MTDYIKREDAVKVAEKYGLANGSVLGRHTGVADCIMSEIASIPAADVAEIKHGHWIFHPALNRIVDDDYFECSLCGYKIYDWDEPPYCQDCGAKMDEENKNTEGKENEQ